MNNQQNTISDLEGFSPSQCIAQKGSQLKPYRNDSGPFVDFSSLLKSRSDLRFENINENLQESNKSSSNDQFEYPNDECQCRDITFDDLFNQSINTILHSTDSQKNQTKPRTELLTDNQIKAEEDFFSRRMNPSINLQNNIFNQESNEQYLLVNPTSDIQPNETNGAKRMITRRGINSSESTQSVLHNKYQSRKQKTYLQSETQTLALNHRKDVIFKAVLRAIRRHYLKQFLTLTRFGNDKSRKNPEVYKQKLLQFVLELIPQIDEKLIGKNEERKDELIQELVFIFGSIFYHKILLTGKYSQEQKQNIELIRSCLYYYSNNTLKAMIEKYDGLQIIIHHSFKNQDEILIQNQCDNKDLKEAFKFLNSFQTGRSHNDLELQR